MKIIVHYPETTEEAEILKKKVAKVHAKSVTQHISKLNCNNVEKDKLVNNVINTIRNY